MKFPPSQLALQYLTGLKGVEIGGSAHNDFFLDTINVDYTDEITVYKQQEKDLCGEFRRVDVVADAANLPFPDKSYDFVITSHVLEHLWDPIAAIEEWRRVAKKYLFITVPRKDLTFDRDKPVTDIFEITKRHSGEVTRPAGSPADDHWSIWDVYQFRVFCASMANMFDMKMVAFQEVDDKVGNGMTVLFDVQ